jgi:prefoldin subunit 5
LSSRRLDCGKEGTVKDINEVLRRKKAQLETLGKQIAQLQAAAEELRSIAHLLTDEENEQAHAAGR